MWTLHSPLKGLDAETDKTRNSNFYAQQSWFLHLIFLKVSLKRMKGRKPRIWKENSHCCLHGFLQTKLSPVTLTKSPLKSTCSSSDDLPSCYTVMKSFFLNLCTEVVISLDSLANTYLQMLHRSLIEWSSA